MNPKTAIEMDYKPVSQWENLCCPINCFIASAVLPQLTLSLPRVLFFCPDFSIPPLPWSYECIMYLLSKYYLGQKYFGVMLAPQAHHSVLLNPSPVITELWTN